MSVYCGMRQLLGILILIVVFQGCKKPGQAPAFKYVSNVKVTSVSGKEAVLHGDAVFYNPNDMSMKLRKVNIDVMLEGKKIGGIHQGIKMKIPAQSEFKVPVDAKFNVGEIGVLNSLLSVLGGKKMKVHYKGRIRLSVYGVPVSVPVDYEDEIRLRL